MQCVKPVYLYGTGYVPCGKCMACRIARTREWTVRILHEADSFEASSFVTLTYSPANLPADNGLHKRHLQLFFKRLRRDYANRIRYYACGEYGDMYDRPHYHAIILGLPTRDLDQVEDAWGLGYVKIGSVNKNSVQYVAGYVQKKYSGELARERYGVREPPFQVCSKGFGKGWAMENKDYLIRNLGITVQGVPMGMPRYYRKVLGEEITQDMLSDARLERLEESRQWLADRGIGPLEEWKQARDERGLRAEELKAKAELKQRKAF